MARMAPPCRATLRARRCIASTAAGDSFEDFAGVGAVRLRAARRSRRSASATGRRRAGRRPDPTSRSCQPSSVLHELPDRQGVEELVGDDEDRVFADGVDLAGPVGRVGAEPLFLLATQQLCWSRRAARCSAFSKPSALLAARSASAISVPRPGPSSSSVKLLGSPICCQRLTMKKPISSPNIWLISGAVMKSPSAPIGRPTA